MMTRQGTRLVLALAIAVAACGPGAERESLGKMPAAPSVVVSNHNFMDMNVYVVQAGMRARLGRVTGLSSGRFQLPRALGQNVADVRILADPVGGSQSYLSPAVRLQPGQRLELTLGATLVHSSLSVWER
jgi:hypothetical protein